MELWGPTLVGELWNSGAYTCFERGELWNFQYIFMGRFRLNPRAKFMGCFGASYVYNGEGDVGQRVS